jgi:hypothetical protein
MTDELERKIEDLLVARIAAEMSVIEVGDATGDQIRNAVDGGIAALLVEADLTLDESVAMYRRATERAHPRIMAILRAKGMPATD